MGLAAMLKGAGFVLAGAVGLAPAQTPHSMTDGVPCSSWAYCTPSNHAPPCATPGHPHLPGTIVVPAGPATPAPSPAQPGAPTPAPAAAPAEAAAAATADTGTGSGGGGERGSGGVASLAPNMYGDAFGGPPLRVVIARPPVVIPAKPGLPA